MSGIDFPNEVLEAFGAERKIRASRSRAGLSWLGRKCQLAAAAAEDGEPGAGMFELFKGDRTHLNIFEKQTYTHWKATMDFEKMKHPIRQRRKVVLIQPISWGHGSQIPSSIGGEKGEHSYAHTQISSAVLQLLRQFCSAFYNGMSVQLAPPLDLSDIPKLTSRVHKVTNRRQFLVDDIINFLHSHRLKKCYCVLAVTVVDLYPGSEWNFVLGQACLYKSCGVFSFGRYFNSSAAGEGDTVECVRSAAGDGDTVECVRRATGDGDTVECVRSATGDGDTVECVRSAAGDGDTVECVRSAAGDGDTVECVRSDQTQLEKWESEQLRNIWILMRVMSHELGHLFGLAHCFYFQCAMNESCSINEAATQPLFLCPICLKKVQTVLECDLLERYLSMEEVMLKIEKAVSGLDINGRPAPSKTPPLSLSPTKLNGSAEFTKENEDLVVVEGNQSEEACPNGLMEQERQVQMLAAALLWLREAQQSLRHFRQEDASAEGHSESRSHDRHMTLNAGINILNCF